jgi:hypothetical protein
MMLKAWKPKSAFEYGIFLEDDVEVSKYYFSWIIFQFRQHLFDPYMLKNFEDEEDMEIFVEEKLMSKLADPDDSRWLGISLYAPKLNEIAYPAVFWNFTDIYAASEQKTVESLTEIPSAFLMQLPCSWGALYFPWWWLLFLEYSSLRLTLQLHVADIPNSRSNRWANSWKK